MGAKAGILALADGDAAAALRRRPRADAERTRALLAEIYPGYHIDPTEGEEAVAFCAADARLLGWSNLASTVAMLSMCRRSFPGH